jgi:hypothetical protein
MATGLDRTVHALKRGENLRAWRNQGIVNAAVPSLKAGTRACSKGLVFSALFSVFLT